MSLQWKFLLWTFVIGFLLCAGVTRWADKENKRLESNRDSMITEHHRLQREIEWQYDSIQAIINRQLDTLIYKANKYDSIERTKGRNN